MYCILKYGFDFGREAGFRGLHLLILVYHLFNHSLHFDLSNLKYGRHVLVTEHK